MTRIFFIYYTVLHDNYAYILRVEYNRKIKTMVTIQRFDTNHRMSKTVIYGGMHIFCGQTVIDRSIDIKGQT